MARQAEKKKVPRKRHSQAFKDEALALAEKVGVGTAARDLGLHESQLYDWRKKIRSQNSQSEIEQQQATEIARLKRQLAERDEELAIVKKAATYFAKNLK